MQNVLFPEFLKNEPEFVDNKPVISKRIASSVDVNGNLIFRMTGRRGDDLVLGKYALISSDNTKGSGRRDVMLQMQREGFSRKEIANAFSISESRVSQIINNY